MDAPWPLRPADDHAVARLASALQVPDPVARVLWHRGLASPEAASRFLSPRLSDMPDPFSMRGLADAADRLVQAIEEQEPVTLYGDFDVDGVTSSALVQSFLLHHGLRARVYIPHRLEEGYGLNPAAVEQLAGEGTRLLVTLDCGITAVDEVERARALGIDVIVVDHHRCPPALPRAVATLNPHHPDCAYPDKVLAAVGVAFNLVVGVRKRLREAGFYARTGIEEPRLKQALDLVALGTIADMVPLTGVNRMLAWFGLQEMAQARRPGLRALMEVAQIRPRKVRSQDVAFKLAPRINAAGRLDDASVGVQLLTSGRMDEARRHAATLDAANADRRLIEAEVFRAAEGQAQLDQDAPGVVVADPEWHPGVVGIVASRLVERYGKPAVVVGRHGRGSARTAGALHLYDALAACRDHLVKFGGHRAAAGFRLGEGGFSPFRTQLLEVFRAEADAIRDATPPVELDLSLLPEALSLDLVQGLERLGPFGVGNPEPLCGLAGPVRRVQVVGGQHLKLRFGDGPRPVSAIAFKQGALEPSLGLGTQVDVAGCLEVNDFGGFERVEVRVREIQARTDAPAALVG